MDTVQPSHGRIVRYASYVWRHGKYVRSGKYSIDRTVLRSEVFFRKVSVTFRDGAVSLNRLFWGELMLYNELVQWWFNYRSKHHFSILLHTDLRTSFPLYTDLRTFPLYTDLHTLFHCTQTCALLFPRNRLSFDHPKSIWWGLQNSPNSHAFQFWV